jgi:hypothetical protein
LQPFAQLSSPIEAALRASIQRFGVLVPITTDQNGTVIDGHHRQRIKVVENDLDEKRIWALRRLGVLLNASGKPPATAKMPEWEGEARHDGSLVDHLVEVCAFARDHESCPDEESVELLFGLYHLIDASVRKDAALDRLYRRAVGGAR